MPEGHTIHRLARDQRDDLAGRAIRAWSPQGRFTDGAAVIDGRTLDRVDAWGKHLFLEFAGQEVLYVHLGLIGKFRRKASPPPDPVGAIRLRLVGPERTWDLSGPQSCVLVSPPEREAIVAKLGPDPLRRGADPDRAWAKISRSNKAIGALLLDQAVIAGIGNVYRAEVLFLEGVHPTRTGRDLGRSEWDRIWARTVDQLRRGVKLNRIVTRDRDEVTRPLSKLSRDEALYVYHRDTCRRCGSAIQVLDVAGRRIWACPSCQPK